MTEPSVLPYRDPAFVADPFPFYKILREEGPVRRVVLANEIAVWMVTRYEDALAAFSDPRLSSDLADAADREMLERLPASERSNPRSSMLRANPPDHTRLRRLVSKVFTARRVQEMRPRVQEITDGLLDAVTPLGRADLIEDFALPLPVTVIGELLGVPAEDRKPFQSWTNDLLVNRTGPPDHAKMSQAWEQMESYLVGLLAAKRAEPGADLLSALIESRDTDHRLDEAELVSMAFLLLVAGYITTVNLIGSGVTALLAHPDQLELLRENPDLLPGAVEEFLRYDGPVDPGLVRFPTEDIEIGGVAIPRGATVMLATAVADRDPLRFTEPDRLDITRTENSHLAFGHGIHFCLGAPLARLEGQIAIGSVLARMPDLALAVPFGEVKWQIGGLRGPKRLPVTFTPSGPAVPG